ncbi:carbon-phosphorus lyase complex subunit PhnI [Mycolicibacterium pulveris]|uniref:Carbon-phosphorus lyase complex subunit PhnI n=1 Tax=Mycolicibacterium pulveris TaxID=36813 RepID=A0A7I7UR00_MYCPV|nr:carbon-phosphorus lyase complex subunit PhnI [Mycolicibacterium pulveris]MCV6982574.1 carbon-phosphorus lyase complex subunit PhnI [Mycolicibacterium pulveris]BBY83767.1 carbon-phosphorus lyase complex subunit PhnI [Mycolicibacterium pulveris]
MYASMHENDALEAARAIADRRAVQPGSRTDTSALEEQVCAEAGLWELAAARRALHQSRGDASHAVSMLRVWAATQPHVQALPVGPDDVAIVRRLSSAYPRVPGGQWLGIAPELRSRQLDWTDERPTVDVPGGRPTVAQAADAPTRAGTPRVRDLIDDAVVLTGAADGDGDDPARAVMTPPFTRANRLALLARGETGALVALAALILGRRQEAVMVELTVGTAVIRVPHPRSGAPCAVAEIPITEVEVVLDADAGGGPALVTGWGATLGTVERRAISLALLDAAMQADGDMREPVTLDEQTVIAATDGPATNGFVEHLRLPHYASFAAYLAQVGGKTKS